MQHITTSSIKHATTVPIATCREGKDGGKKNLTDCHYFQEKICAMESVGYRIYKMANGDGRRRRRRRRVGEEKWPVCGFFYATNLP